MLKLNNKGWGLATLIAFICVFIVFLIVVGILVWNWNRGVDTEANEALTNNIILINS